MYYNSTTNKFFSPVVTWNEYFFRSALPLKCYPNWLVVLGAIRSKQSCFSLSTVCILYALGSGRVVKGLHNDNYHVVKIDLVSSRLDMW